MAKAEKKNIADVFKQNPTIAFLAAMVLLVGLRLAMAAMGGGAPPALDAEPTVVKIDPKIDETKVSYLVFAKMLEPLPPFQESELFPLAQYNMFDPKVVQNSDALEKSASDRVAQAQAALAANNLPQARDLARQALGMRPDHAGARQVLRDIDLREHPTPTPTPTPAAANGAAPGGPPGFAPPPGARGAAPGGAPMTPGAAPGAAPAAPGAVPSTGAAPAPGTPGGAGR